MLSLVLIAALTAPGIEFTRSFAPTPAPLPVRIDECAATRNGGDLVYSFDVRNTAEESVAHVDVSFVFQNPGDKTPRGVQRFSIAKDIEPGQMLRYAEDTQQLRRPDVSHGARYGACEVVGVRFGDGSEIDAPR
jgi:hypothetical protein